MHYLLVIAGSVAAYKSLELIRLFQRRGDTVDVILTHGGAQFITPLAVSSLTGRPTYTDLFSLKDEVEMGHIRLSREADRVLVAPASADLIAKLANGLADDLASTTLLANSKPLFIAPAMNAQMWDHPATKRNMAQIEADGAHILLPDSGALACGEIGPGRLMEPADILAALDAFVTAPASGLLSGKRAIVTAGPTHEPIDPVRYLSNRSSGKQGYAIAEALAVEGADVILISGPVALEAPRNVKRLLVETAEEMSRAVESSLPADVFIATAAVADWRPAEISGRKLKKASNEYAPTLALTENPDILAALSRHAKRPSLVIGFAAETEDLLENAKAKLARKGCDWILANEAVFGSEDTTLHLIDAFGIEPWGTLTKKAAAAKLACRIASQIDDYKSKENIA